MFLRLILLFSFLAMLSACAEEEGLPRGDGDGSDGSSNEVGTIELGETAAVAQIPFSYQIPEANTLVKPSFSIKQLPAWADIDSQTGEIFGTPSAADITAYAPVELEIKGTLAGSPEKTKTITFSGHLSVHHTSAALKNDQIDYYDTPFDGSPRQYRNDLEGGELKGEVQFLQTHASAPSQAVNYNVVKEDETKSQYIPNIVALREALLLFIPEKGIEPITLHVRVSAPGKPELLLSMAHPNDLFAVDKGEVSRLQYSKRAWSVKLPWDYIRKGLELEFVADQSAPNSSQGVLPAAQIDTDKATYIEFHTLRLGMLTEPPRGNANERYNLIDPVLAATDYFQTLPTSQLVMASYADAHLTSTIVNQSGKARVYDVNSKDPNDHASDSTDASVYSGDMRENVGKSQVSVGINLANYGIASWDLTQRYSHFYKAITSHHARGMYKCGDNENCPSTGVWEVGHGLSGGNGIGTLYSSSGNEASHEWGHAYGLGHYPGDLKADGRWAIHNPMTGWGFLGYRNRLRSNVYAISEDKNVVQKYIGNDGHERRLQFKNGGFMYAYDSMSGGNNNGSPFSKYAFYAGYSAHLIQRDLNQFPVPDAEYGSGYKKWDTERGEYVEVTPQHNGQPYPVPVKSGVPVATILGGYDPEPHHYAAGEKRAVIYPIFHGNYGKVYDLPAPNLNGNEDACWVTVEGAGGTKQVALGASRHNADSINQLHFNLEASFKPSSATLFCRHNGEETELAHTKFDGQIPELPPVAIVGQEHGYEQLKAREIKEITKEIMALAPDNVMQASDGLLSKIYAFDEAELEQRLDSSAWSYVKELLDITRNTANIEAVINYGEAKGLGENEIKQSLEDYLLETGLSNESQNFVPQGEIMHGFWGPYAAAQTAYLSTVPAENGRLHVKPVSDGEAEQHRWVMDAQGRIHPERDLSLCLTATGPITLTACNSNNSAQKWAYKDNGTLQAHGGTGQCMDNYASQENHVNLYGCTGNWNQRWELSATNQDVWFAFASSNIIKQVLQVLAQ